MNTSELLLTGAQVIFAGALVVVTVGYTYYSARVAEETKLSREIEIEPVIKPNIDVRASTLIALYLDNIGRSAARDVKFTWELGGEKHEFRKQLLRPGENVEFPIIIENDRPVLNYEKIKENVDSKEGDNKLKWEVYYTNLSGERKNDSGKFDVIESVDGMLSVKFSVREDDIQDIVKKLDEISDKLEGEQN